MLFTFKDIAEYLGVSPDTVSNHAKKLGLKKKPLTCIVSGKRGLRLDLDNWHSGLDEDQAKQVIESILASGRTNR